MASRCPRTKKSSRRKGRFRLLRLVRPIRITAAGARLLKRPRLRVPLPQAGLRVPLPQAAGGGAQGRRWFPAPARTYHTVAVPLHSRTGPSALCSAQGIRFVSAQAVASAEEGELRCASDASRLTCVVRPNWRQKTMGAPSGDPLPPPQSPARRSNSLLPVSKGVDDSPIGSPKRGAPVASEEGALGVPPRTPAPAARATSPSPARSALRAFFGLSPQDNTSPATPASQVASPLPPGVTPDSPIYTQASIFEQEGWSAPRSTPASAQRTPRTPQSEGGSAVRWLTPFGRLSGSFSSSPVPYGTRGSPATSEAASIASPATPAVGAADGSVRSATSSPLPVGVTPDSPIMVQASIFDGEGWMGSLPPVKAGRTPSSPATPSSSMSMSLRKRAAGILAQARRSVSPQSSPATPSSSSSSASLRERAAEVLARAKRLVSPRSAERQEAAVASEASPNDAVERIADRLTGAASPLGRGADQPHSEGGGEIEEHTVGDEGDTALDEDERMKEAVADKAAKAAAETVFRSAAMAAVVADVRQRKAESRRATPSSTPQRAAGRVATAEAATSTPQQVTAAAATEATEQEEIDPETEDSSSKADADGNASPPPREVPPAANGFTKHAQNGATFEPPADVAKETSTAVVSVAPAVVARATSDVSDGDSNYADSALGFVEPTWVSRSGMLLSFATQVATVAFVIGPMFRRRRLRRR